MSQIPVLNSLKTFKRGWELDRTDNLQDLEETEV